MVSTLLKMLIGLVSADQVGGWARALVAVLLGGAATWFGGALVPFLTPEFQMAVGVVISTILVGSWSTIAKWIAELK